MSVCGKGGSAAVHREPFISTPSQHFNVHTVSQECERHVTFHTFSEQPREPRFRSRNLKPESWR